MPETGGLLAIFAHPDDETLVAGTMARYRDAGLAVTMVCATRGEVGEIAPGTGATPETLGEFREQELRDACAAVGVGDVRFLDFRDSGMRGTPENDDPRNLHMAPADRVVEPLVRAIRELRPRAIATWDESGGYGHPDHIAVHYHATAAFHAAADPSHAASAGEPWRTNALFYSVIPFEEFGQVMEEMRAQGVEIDPPGDAEALAALPRVPANCIIDVSAQYARKMQAMASHRTQAGDMDQFFKMPDELRRRIFGREWYHRTAPAVSPGKMLDDLFSRPA
ncbi:MAG: PIG-L family deacetylase [Dehalococcoidia bacterium]